MGDISTSFSVQYYGNCGLELQEFEAATTNPFDDGANIAADKENDSDNYNDSNYSIDKRNEISNVDYTNVDDDKNNKTNGTVKDNETNNDVGKNNEDIIHAEDDRKTFEYDVFISYSFSDRPWVKDVLLQTLEQEGKTVCIDYRDFPAGQAITDNVVHAIKNSRWTIVVLTPAFVKSEWCMFESKQALISSLATSKARVLPLILMECAIPNILRHLTYLDHTSEDVQPFFNKQLIDSLNLAKTWSPTIDQLETTVTVPKSEVETVVTRTLDQKDKYKNAYTKLASAYYKFKELASRVIRIIAIAIIFVLFMSILTIGFFLYNLIQANWIYSAFPLVNRSSLDEAFPMSFSVFDVKGNAGKHCQIIWVRNKYKGRPRVLVDIYAFNKPFHDIIYARKSDTHHKQIYLPQDRQYRFNKSSIKPYQFCTTKFCYQSAKPKGKAGLWVYKLQKKFSSSKCSILSNTTYCNETNENNDFVFFNPGPSPIFLNVSTNVNTMTYRSHLVERLCFNSSECKLATPPKIVIIQKTYDTDKNPIIVYCVYTVSKAIFSLMTSSILFVLCVLLWAILKLYRKKCVPCLRKWYFNRESIRESLGEVAVNMLDKTVDVEDFFKEVEKENKKYKFVYKRGVLERFLNLD